MEQHYFLTNLTKEKLRQSFEYAEQQRQASEAKRGYTYTRKNFKHQFGEQLISLGRKLIQESDTALDPAQS